MVEKYYEEFEKDFNEYKEYCEIITSMLAIFDTIDRDGTEFSTNVLLSKVLQGMEKYDIPFAGLSTNELYKILYDKKEKIIQKSGYKYEFKTKLNIYENLIPCNSFVDADYNLIKILVENGYDEWVRSFLVSDINIETRVYMLFDYLMETYDTTILEGTSGYLFAIKKSDEERAEKIEELGKAFDNNTALKEQLFFTFISLEKYANIHTLQKFIDFSGFTIERKSVPEYIYSKTKDNCLFHRMFNSKGFQENNSNEEKNKVLCNVIGMMKYNYSLLDIIYTLKKVDFIPNELIINEILNIFDYKLMNDGVSKNLTNYTDNLEEILIRKASNKKEYKEYKIMAGNLNKELIKKYEDYHYIDDIETEQKNELKKLFTRYLYDFNDYLQDNYPGKRLIKNLDYKKKD